MNRGLESSDDATGTDERARGGESVRKASKPAVPVFRTEAEEIEFWETHDVDDYLTGDKEPLESVLLGDPSSRAADAEAVRPVSGRPRNGRYLGDASTREVHDLRNERPQCRIDEMINAGHAVLFSPDSVEAAREIGYDSCAYCLGGSAEQ